MFKYLIALLLLIPSAHAKFAHESEASTVVNRGNSNLESYLLKTSNKYQWSENITSLLGQYTYGETNDIPNVDSWNLSIRYERKLNDRLGIFLAEEVESNRFAGYKRRYNTDLGGKYRFIQNENNTTSFELGYRYTVENPTNEGTRKENKGRLAVETEHKFNENYKVRFGTEYIPNFTYSQGFLVNTQASLTAVLNRYFSLKTSYQRNYDNKPLPGNSKYDSRYTTALVASFQI
ncbi:MAG: DUF481 domain-containing protein [Bacteriovoracia bacterium]